MSFLTGNPPPAAVKNPEVQKQPYVGVAVDSKYEPRKMLITHVEGSKWVVNYFQQFLGRDDEKAAQQINRPEVYQQYQNIIDMELRVTSPLSATQDTGNKEFTYIGAATMYIGIKPNEGDMFIADVGDGRSGLFVVTLVEQKSILRDSTYAIEYEMKDFLTPDLHNDLLAKVSKTVHFVRDFIAMGKNPLLVSSELETYRLLTQWLDECPITYYGDFFSDQYSTFLVPDQDELVYDPMIVEFVKRIVDIDKHPRYTHVKALNCDTNDKRSLTTVLDAIYEMRDSILDTASLESEMILARTVNQLPRFSGIRYSGISYLYFPKGSGGQLGVVADRLLLASKPRQFNRPYTIEAALVYEQLPANIRDGVEYWPVPYYDVHHDSGYIFSHHFYGRRVGEMSLLEIMVRNLLTKKPNNVSLVYELCKSSIQWGQVERFYFLPILMVIVANCIRDIN